MALGATAEGEEERSLRDDLAAGLKEIGEREASEQAASVPSNEGAEPPKAEAHAEVAQPEANRSDGRDAHGKFVAKPKEGEVSPPASEALPQSELDKSQASVPSEAAQSASQLEQDAPPKSWRADEAKAWASLPPEAKAAITRREAEAARLAGANDSERMFGREFAEVVRPHMDVIQSFGVTPQFAVRALLENDRVLRSGTQEQKLAKAQQLVADYGIDLTALAQAPQQDPTVVALNQKIAALEQRLTAPQQQQFAPLPPTQEEHSILSEIEAFRADPAHPHFDAVQQRMGQLLEAGSATDLDSAYAMAVAADPALRSTVAVPVPPSPAPAANHAQKAAAARAASVSVAGSPGPTGNQAPTSLRDELREGLRNAGFGSV